MAETDDQKITDMEAAPEVEVATSEVAAAPEPPKATPPKRRGGFFAPVLGGVIAAGAGYGLAQYVPDGWPIADTSALQSTIDAQAAELAALKDQIAALPAPQAAPDLTPINEAVADLTARLADLESRPTTPGEAPDLSSLQSAVSLLQSDIAALKSAGLAPSPENSAAADALLKEAEAQATAMKAEAEALTRAATARAALGRLQAAIDNGAPFAEHLPDLGLEVPAALGDFAQSGLASLSSLQTSFPDVARAALDAALRSDMGDTWSERATNFIFTQTGARSLTPQEGNDPNAILSRAEAALFNGNIDLTLTELSALPSAAQPALTDWRALAEQRQAGLKALAYVAGKIEG